MIYFYINIFFLSFIYSQSYINPNVYGSDLLDYLEDNYKTTSTLGYTNCRDLMYSEIDIKNNNQLSCVYSGYTITLDLSQDPSTNAFEQGINCEHTWPQSLGAGSEPMKSDMHHLFPTKSAYIVEKVVSVKQLCRLTLHVPWLLKGRQLEFLM